MKIRALRNRTPTSSGRASNRWGTKSIDCWKSNNVRLTMGGEPTFVSIDDMDGAEWNTTALGPKNAVWRERCFAVWPIDSPLGRCCIMAKASGIPASSCRAGRWVAIGAAMANRFGAIHSGLPKTMLQYGYDDNHAQQFITALAERLNVGAENTIAAYEDAWYYLWKERRLPVNVDPFDSKLELPEDRERLAKVFEQGLQKVVGLCAAAASARAVAATKRDWESGPWFVRRGADVFDPGRFAAGLSLAAGFAAVVGSGRTTSHLRSRSVWRSWPVAAIFHERRFAGMPIRRRIGADMPRCRNGNTSISSRALVDNGGFERTG